jgi:hypothetical protein
LTTAADAPIVISRPLRSTLVEPENDAIIPVDPQTKRACQGTRFGRANVIDLELDGNQGAALLEASNQRLYFARIRCQ